MYVTTISDQDLGDLIAYLKQIPPVNSDESAIKWGPIIPIASAIGVFPPVAGTIDHNAPRPPDPAPAVTKEYGKYLSAICAQCHIGGIAYAVKNWKQEDFIHAINTGYAPDGKLIGPTMSSQTFREMNEKELSALWLYLQSQH